MKLILKYFVDFKGQKDLVKSVRQMGETLIDVLTVNVP